MSRKSEMFCAKSETLPLHADGKIAGRNMAMKINEKETKMYGLWVMISTFQCDVRILIFILET